MYPNTTPQCTEAGVFNLKISNSLKPLNFSCFKMKVINRKKFQEQEVKKEPHSNENGLSMEVEEKLKEIQIKKKKGGMKIHGKCPICFILFIFKTNNKKSEFGLIIKRPKNH